MSDTLEAQARDMLNPHRQLICGCMAVTCPRVDRIAGLVAAWARCLVADAVSECARNHVNVVEKLLREKVAAVVQSRAGALAAAVAVLKYASCKRPEPGAQG